MVERSVLTKQSIYNVLLIHAALVVREEMHSFVDCEISGWKPGDETDVEKGVL